MSASKPARREAEVPGGSPDGVPHDPWGIKRAENLIGSLTGIMSARVVATPMGEVTEIHVLTNGQVAAKQVVRNIESALMAQLGLKIDHRKISVAQTAEVQPLGSGEESRVAVRQRMVVFQDLEIRPASKPQRVEMVVRLARGDQRASANAEGTDTPRNRVEAAARATAMALEELLQDHSVALEGAKLIEAFDRQFVLVAIHGLGGREAQLLTGTCEIRESAERAAALAVLDATNRWSDARR